MTGRLIGLAVPCGSIMSTDAPTAADCDWIEATDARLQELQPVGQELQDLGASAKPDTTRVREIAAELEDAAAEQRDSNPSAAYAEASGQIADALQSYADILVAAADALDTNDASGLATVQQDIQDANTLIGDAGAVTAPLADACGLS